MRTVEGCRGTTSAGAVAQFTASCGKSCCRDVVAAIATFKSRPALPSSQGVAVKKQNTEVHAMYMLATIDDTAQDRTSQVQCPSTLHPSMPPNMSSMND